MLDRSWRGGGCALQARAVVALALGLVSAALVAPAAGAATNNIFTVAGTTDGFSGDGGLSTAAQLSEPAGVAATADGGFLIADSFNNRVRRVSPGGTITTLAGTTQGLSGDGGPASAAQLNSPYAVAATAEGGLLVVDRNNQRVRFVDADLRGPASGPTGPAGPDGPEGATGAAGPQGAAGAVGAAGPVGRAFDRLAVALASDRLRARPRQRLTLRYAATTTATVELRVLRGTRRVARVRGKARSGRNTIRLRAPRGAGRYRIELVAFTADGQRTTDRARLTITKSRAR